MHLGRTFALLIVGILLTASPAAFAAPPAITFHGRILLPNGHPENSSSVNFDIQVRSPGAENCLLFEETQNLNMSGSSGIFVLTIGSGSRVAAAVDGGNSVQKIFANRGTLSALPTCAVGNSYSPIAGDGRKLVVQFDDGSGSGWQALPAQDVNYNPLAIEAMQISGYTSDQLLRVADGVTATEFSAADWNALWALVSGSSTVYSKANGSNFSPTSNVNFNGQQITNLGTPTTASMAATKGYVDTNFLGLGGGTLAGSVNLGANSLTNVGHVVIANQGTLYLGKFTNPQEASFIAGPPALGGSDTGRTWYNTTTGRMRYWDGLAAQNVASESYVGAQISVATASMVTAVNGTAGEINSTGGTTPTLSLIATGVAAASYGSSISVPQITVDSKGRITVASNVPISVTGALGYTPVNRAGDTMTGLLVLSADPSAASGAATKQYVDAVSTAASGAYLRKDGTTPLTADWNLGNFHISGLLDPVSASYAATKNYVDTKFAGSVTSVSGIAGQTVITGTSAAPTVGLATTGVGSATYGSSTQIPVLTIDSYGRVTAATYTAASGAVASVTGTAGQIQNNGTAVNPVMGLVASGVGAGSYGSLSQIPVITVDSYGRLTAASSVSMATAVNAVETDPTVATFAKSATGIASRFAINGSNQLDLTNFGVAGTYGSTSQVPILTLDNYGRVTTASYLTVNDTSKLPLAGGTMAGNINMASYKITNLGTPSASYDAATKAYVDAQVGSAGTVTSVNAVSGDTVIGGTSAAPTVGLATTSVVAGTYGATDKTLILSVDSKGRLASASQASIAILPSQLLQGGAANSNFLQWNGSNWAAASFTSSVNASETDPTVSSWAKTANPPSASYFSTTGNILSLASSGVAAATYGSSTQVPVLTVDSKGRITSATFATASVTETDPTVSSWAKVVNPPSASFFSTTGNTLALTTTGVASGSYGSSTQIPVFSVDAYGRVTSASYVSASGAVASVGGTTGQIQNNGTAVNPVLGLVSTGVAAATYGSVSQIPIITVDSYGRVTTASYLSAAIAPSQLTQGGASNSNFLQWNGSNWAAASFSSSVNASETDPTVSSWAKTANPPSASYFSTTGNILSLASSGVAAATYGSSTQVPVLTVDSKGRITSATYATASVTETDPTVATFAKTATGISARFITNGSNQLDLANSGVTAATYGSLSAIPVITVDSYGRLTAASTVSMSSAVNAVEADPTVSSWAKTANPPSASFFSTTGNILALTTTGVSAATYGSSTQIPVLTVDSYGRVIAATYTSASGAVASVGGTTGQIQNNGTATNPVLGLVSTGVSAATYGSVSQIPIISVDSYGRITTASYLSAAIAPSQITQGGAATGSYLSWNGSAWAPASFGASVASAETDPTVSAWAKTVNPASATYFSTTGNILSLASSGVTAATYGSGTQIPVLTVDAKGRITSATFATASVTETDPTVATFAKTATGISGRFVTNGSNQLDLAFTAVTPATYGSLTQIPVVTVDSYGRLTAASSVSLASAETDPTVSSWAKTANPPSASFFSTTGNILALNTTGVSANTYGSSSQIPILTVDSYGRVTSATYANIAAGGVTSVSASAGQTVVSGTASAPVVGLATTGVSSGTYGSTSQIPILTVDSFGRITTASFLSAAIAPSQITQAGAQSGSYLSWNGSAWAPASFGASETDPTVSAWAKIVNPPAATYFSTTGNILSLASSGVTAATYGSGTQIPVLTVDVKGRITSATYAALTGVVTSVASVSGQTVLGGTASAPSIGLATTGVGASTYGSSTQIPVLTLDTFGRVTAATFATASVTETDPTVATFAKSATGIAPRFVTNGSNQLDLASVVTAGTYGSISQIPIITVDSYGRVTTASYATLSNSVALSAITAATAINAIDSASYAQTWNWSTATTQNPMTLTANALTTGSLLNLTSSSGSLNSSNGLLYVANTTAATFGTVARIQSNSAAGSGVTVLANGNVGIGTTAPAAKVEIAAGGATSVPPLSISTTGAAGGGAAPFYGAKIDVYAHNQATAAYGVYGRFNNGFGNPINSYGVYGENTGSPYGESDGVYGKSVQPDVAAAGVASGVKGVVSAAGVNAGSTGKTYAGYFDNSSAVGATAYGLYVNSVSGAADAAPFVAAVAGSEKFRVDVSGKVGIGTTAPNSLLTVAGVEALGETTAPAASTGYGKIYVQSSDHKLYYMDYSGAATQLGTAAGGGVASITGTAGEINITGASNSPNIGLAATGVSAATYGSVSQIPILTIDSKGRVTNASYLAAAIAPSQITQAGAQSGSYLSWNGSSWAPASFGASETDPTVSAWAKIANTPASYFTTTGNILSLASSGVTANTYGSATQVPVLTVDAKGRITSATYAPVSASSIALSGITAAAASNTIDSTSYAQTWNWSTATTQNPMTLTANNLTTGSLLNITSSSASLNSTNGLLNVANSTAGTYGTVARIQSNSTSGSGLTVLANGKVGVGTASPSTAFEVSGGNLTLSGSDLSPSIAMHIYNYGSTSPAYPGYFDWNFIGTASQGNPIFHATNFRGNAGASAALQAGDVLFNLEANGGSGPSWATNMGGKISFIAAESYSATTAGTSMTFSTTNLGSTSPTEKLRIDPAGNIGIGTVSPNALLTVAGVEALGETTAPAASTGYGKIYVQSSDHKLYFMDQSGVATQLGSGAGGGVASITGTAGEINITGASTSPNIGLATTGVGAGTYGSTSQIPILTIDSKGRVTNASYLAAAIAPSQITQAGAQSGSYLSWNGSAWAPASFGASETDPTVSAWAKSANPASATYFSTTGNVLSLASSGVTANTYGSSTQIPVLTVDAKGRITSATYAAISGVVTSVASVTGQTTLGGTASAPSIGLATTAVSAGTYGTATQIPTFVVDSFGRITSASYNALNAYSAGSTILASYGSASTPGFAFNGDTGTGFFDNGGGQIGVSVSGTNVWNITSSSFGSTTVGGALITNGAGTASYPAYAFVGDTDTGIFNASANYLGFSTGGTQKMVVDSNGYLGVGTAAPLGILDVEGGTAAASKNGTDINLHAQNGGSGNQWGGNIILQPGTGSGTSGAGAIYLKGLTSIGGTDYPINTLTLSNTLSLTTSSYTNFKNTLLLNDFPSANAVFIGTNNSVTNLSSAAANATMYGSTNTVTNQMAQFQNATAGQFTVTNSGSGPIVVAKAGEFQVNGPTAITTGYGVYIGTIAATTKYSVYASDSTAPNYFAGNTSVGTSSFNSTFNVGGAMSLAETSAPSATSAFGKLYVNSTDHKLYFMDQAGSSSAWGSGGGGYNAGSIIAASYGVASAPGLTFNGDTGTGFFDNGTGKIGVAISGTNLWNISSSSFSSTTNGSALIESGAGSASFPTYAFVNDSDTGIFNASANYLGFSTGGIQRAVIDSNGYLGVGISAPTGILHVDGGTAAASMNGTDITLKSQNAGSGNQSGGNINLTPGTKSGTGSQGLINFNGAINQTATDANNGGTGAYLVNTLSLITSSYTNLASGLFLSDFPAANSTMIGTQNYVNYMSSAAAGAGTTMIGSTNNVTNYVGISNAVPKATGGQFSVTSLSASGSISVAKAGEFFLSGPGTIATGYGVYVGSIPATTKYSIYTSDSTAPNYFAGNTSVGTTSFNSTFNVGGVMSLAETSAPSATSAFGKLYVNSTDHKLYFMDYSGATTALSAAGGSGVASMTATAPLTITGTATNPIVNLSSSGVAAATYGSSTQIPVLTIDTFGRVTSATYATASGGGGTPHGADMEIQYNVAGASFGSSSNFTYNYTTNTLSVTGDINYTGVLTDTSDRRLKKDIKPIGEALPRIRKMKMYSYIMRNDPNNLREFGVMAQDMYEIIPELVKPIDDTYYGVNYVGLTAWNLQAIQELDRENTKLREQNAKLEQQLQELRSEQEVQKRQIQSIMEKLGSK